MSCGVCTKLLELSSCVNAELKRHSQAANTAIHCQDCLICTSIIANAAAVTFAVLQHVHDGCVFARRGDHDQAVSARATTEPAPRLVEDGVTPEELMPVIGNENGPGILSPRPIPVIDPCCICGRDATVSINQQRYCVRHCKLRSVKGMKE